MAEIGCKQLSSASGLFAGHVIIGDLAPPAALLSPASPGEVPHPCGKKGIADLGTSDPPRRASTLHIFAASPSALTHTLAQWYTRQVQAHVECGVEKMPCTTSYVDLAAEGKRAQSEVTPGSGQDVEKRRADIGILPCSVHSTCNP